MTEKRPLNDEELDAIETNIVDALLNAAPPIGAKKITANQLKSCAMAKSYSNSRLKPLTRILGDVVDNKTFVTRASAMRNSTRLAF